MYLAKLQSKQNNFKTGVIAHQSALKDGEL